MFGVLKGKHHFILHAGKIKEIVYPSHPNSIFGITEFNNKVKKAHRYTEREKKIEKDRKREIEKEIDE